MDWAIIVDRSCTFAALVLPVWIVWRLPRYYLSVPIGALMCWGWLMVDGYLLPALDSEYDSIAPGLWLVFGWVVGVAYCCFLVGICEIVAPGRKSGSAGKISERATTGNFAVILSVLGLTAWGGLSVLCICYPFIDKARYGMTDWLFNLFAFGPTLLLSITMLIINFRCLLKN